MRLRPDRNGFKRKLSQKTTEIDSSWQGNRSKEGFCSCFFSFYFLNMEKLTSHSPVERNDSVKNNTKCSLREKES